MRVNNLWPRSIMSANRATCGPIRVVSVVFVCCGLADNIEIIKLTKIQIKPMSKFVPE